MRTTVWIAAACAVVLVARAVAADDPTDVKLLIERFLKAAGGSQQLTQPRAYTYEYKRTMKVPGKPDVVGPGTYYVQPPDKMRLEEEIQMEGKPVKYVQVINGDKGWSNTGGERRDLTQSRVSRLPDPQRQFPFGSILLLRDPAYAAAKMGESELNGRPVEGIQLTYRAGRFPQVSRLFFDKTTGLLAMRERGDPQKKSSYMESVYEDYRMIEGVAIPHKVTHTSVGVAPAGRDESTTIHVYSNFKFVERFDPKLFEAP